MCIYHWYNSLYNSSNQHVLFRSLEDEYMFDDEEGGERYLHITIT